MSIPPIPAPPSDPTPATPGVPAGWYHDAASGRMRWWDGTKWTENFQAPGAAGAGNGAATASLILGICGFVLAGIPFFIGLFLGGIPDLLAVIFGIAGLQRQAQLGGAGKIAATVGIVLGGVSILSMFFGAGIIW